MSGLTEDEVSSRVSKGLTNTNTDVKTKSVGRILADHTLTLFNAVNLGMALLVFLTGSYKNMAFVVVVFANLFIGVFQELRAKRMVDKLSILTAKEVRVLRSGEERSIAMSDIVLDDLVIVRHGDQIPADGSVVCGSAHVNESLLTGESNSIEKGEGSEVFSGSFVETGSLCYRVTKVGRDGYAAAISAEAKYVKPIRSEILGALNFIIRAGTYALIPLGLGLFLRIVFSARYDFNQAVLQTVAAVVGMIPQGLVLLTSSVFAIATTRLAARKVLVQQSYCVETLARVDVLCLDKTGTITTGAMEVGDISGEEALEAAYAVARANESDANETAMAIISCGEERGIADAAVERIVPFSSKAKYSGCVLEGGRSLVMGAAQFVLGERFREFEDQVRSFDRLERVLVVGECDGFGPGGELEGEVRVLGFLGIRDEIRDTAAQTMKFFKERGVEIRVISGDDPYTVSAIAEKVGVPDADRYVDASTLEGEREVARAVRESRVFGRVTPQMKRELVRKLHDEGYVVAMTGDGVNDVLALKEADCSVAMASGSAAARNIAEIVLADNDFAHMPEVVAQGRQSINNLERSAALFLMKTVYTAALACICIVLPPYPFIPVQMSLVSTAIIGVPSFILALEPNHDIVRGRFVGNVLRKSLPASFAITVMMFATLIVSRVLGWDDGTLSSTCMFEMFAIGIALIYKISAPLNALRAFVLVLVCSVAVLGCTVFGSFFSVSAPTLNSVAVALCVAAVGIFLFVRAYDNSASDDSGMGLVARIADRVEGANGSGR
ncbi:MAG: HAD-IC family P-type ATPase [Olsenella sp.]|nr:HAD-IC family P-type ATPase [Olsenella sp.]